jgi:hypothetical protein
MTVEKILRILFPIWFDIEDINDCVDEEVNGVANRNYELLWNEEEYQNVMGNLNKNV